MTWTEIDQQATRKAVVQAAVAVSLTQRRNGAAQLNVTIDAETLAALRWKPGATLLSMAEGDGEHAGWVRLAPVSAPTGRVLRVTPNSTRGGLAQFTPSPRLGRWEAPRLPATYRVRGNVLEVELPWDLSGDPEALAEAEVAA